MQPTLMPREKSLKRFTHEYQYLFVLILGLAIALITEPAVAQCVGWMCGPKDALTQNQVINGSPVAAVFIDFIFLSIQILILLALGALALTFFWKMDRDENYIKPMVGLLVALLLIFGSNYVAGYLMGGTGAQAGGQNAPAPNAPAPNAPAPNAPAPPGQQTVTTFN